MTRKQILISAKLMIVTVVGVGLFFSPIPQHVEAGTNRVECAILPTDICDAANNEGDIEDSGIWGLLLLTIRLMTVGIGIVAVAAITYAGFIYTTAQDSTEQTKKAKTMILNTVIGLLAFGLMWALLEYLIPGGVFT